MKDIRAGLFAFLSADPVVSALVTANGIARIYPIKMPEGVKLASVVYTRISGQSEYTMQGPDGLARSRMQIDAWAPTAPAASALANVVKDAINGYRGTMGSVVVQGVFMENERESFDDIVQMFGVSRDYFIHHEEL